MATKVTRKVGDIHPKHPTLVWTEYAKGKFDWRTNPKYKKGTSSRWMAQLKSYNINLCYGFD